MPTRAPINNIIPFSLVDGPGARCTVFVQGCNIRCAYCHNPETQTLCAGCGACVYGCPVGALALARGQVVWNEAVCIGCDACIRVCPHRSSPRVRHLDAAAVFSKVRECMPFIRGVTCSGGECMLYPRFLLELFASCHTAGLNCLIDSNGTVDFSGHAELLAATDGVMLDVKAWSESCFEHLTGAGGATVKANLAFLAAHGKLAEVRIIVTQGWNDPKAAVLGVAALLSERCADTRLRLMRFRPFGVRGPMETVASPSDDLMGRLEGLASELGYGEVTVS